MKAIAGRLLRELERKLPTEKKAGQRENFALYRCGWHQRLSDRKKLYSLHEPQVYCVAKGKEHKKYEFESKTSVVMPKTAGIIVGLGPLSGELFCGFAQTLVLPGAEFARTGGHGCL